MPEALPAARPAPLRRVVASVNALFRLPAGLVLLLVGLGLLASLVEGVGITLFIPLLHSLAPGSEATADGGALVRRLLGWTAALAPERRLPVLVVAIVGAVALKAAFLFAYGAAAGAVGARASHRLRTTLYGRLLHARYAFLEQTPYGRLLNGLATETWRATDALSAVIGLYISAVTALVYLLILVLLSWKLTILVGLGLLVISGLARLAARRVEPLGRVATAANTALAQRMSDGLAGVKQIRVFGREGYETTRFSGASEHVSRTFWKLGVVGGLVSPIFEVLSAALVGAVLLLQLRSPEDLPALLVFLFVLYRLKPRVEQIDSGRVKLSGLMASVEEMEALLAAPRGPDTAEGQALPHLREDIRLDGVSFRYRDDETPALRAVDLTIPAGRTTALVGPSGAGKSTVLKLLLRLYDPTAGAVRVGETALQEIRLADWRARLAVVSQEAYLFDATVADNIGYGREGASRADVEEAARLAHAHDFIARLPQGYDTRVHERGVRLSGGQQQRIALARALVRDPDLLLLDEATNALDALSERLVQDALEAFGGTRTVVVVAHRLSTIERADHIVVMNEGGVAETGTFADLMARGGLFARLYRAQAQAALT